MQYTLCIPRRHSGKSYTHTTLVQTLCGKTFCRRIIKLYCHCGKFPGGAIPMDYIICFD